MIQTELIFPPIITASSPHQPIRTQIIPPLIQWPTAGTPRRARHALANAARLDAESAAARARGPAAATAAVRGPAAAISAGLGRGHMIAAANAPLIAAGIARKIAAVTRARRRAMPPRAALAPPPLFAARAKR